MITRRAILLTGGASVVVLAGGTGASLLTKSIDPVRQPWREAAEGFGDVRLDALAYAILAPNPHNRQPWLVRLDGHDGLTVFCDLDRLLPETDPPNRQITIGFGAFLELLRQAAAQRGYRAEFSMFPEGEPQPVLDERPVARVTFFEDETVARDPLFGYSLERRTVRDPFDSSRTVSRETLSQLSELAGGMASEAAQFAHTVDETRMSKLKRICRDSWEIEANTERTLIESVELTRIGANEVNANPDGISLYGPRMEAFRLLGLVSRKGMAQVGGSGHRATVAFYNDLIDSAAAFGWLSTPANSRADQLRAGAMWVRLQLAATQTGLAMQPLSQVLQEFPEMAALYAEFHREVGIEEPARVQGLFRFGYADYPEPAPRWSLKSRLITA